MQPTDPTEEQKVTSTGMGSPGFNPFIFDLPAPIPEQNDPDPTQEETASAGGLIQSASAQQAEEQKLTFSTDGNAFIFDPATQNAANQQQYPAPPQYAPLPEITYLLSETVKIKTVLLELLQSMSTSQHSVIDAPRVLELLAQLGS